MKRFLFFMLALLPVIAIAKKPKNVRLAIVSPQYKDPAVFQDDNVTFEFSWDSSDIGVNVKISNNTDSRIYIEWENSRLDDEPICFGSDNSFTYRDQKPDEVVHSGSYSKRFVARKSQFENEYRRLFYWDSTFKKYGESSAVPIIIPVKIGDNVTDYSFQIKVVSDKE